ncbi:YbbC/YhhH family protein [Flavobacterium sp. SH_e]|uniref:YbbC/YhhH family protein n=1 Tax=Flavobacterium sp. SH_e TaxID=2983767 RepID=UPI0021E3FFA6|nr:YbbC/YhhH family protein [Flavobacterium sp. SH_e]MCV2486319.1 YbbC/YhhH family protein [Flavobacterium sp. SH_e]
MIKKVLSNREIELKILIALLLILIFSCCSHSKYGSDQAEFELKRALEDPSHDNFVDNKKVLIKDNQTAIKIAEPILFSIYGEDEIKHQKPYEVNLINNHYVINGTLLWGEQGGTFLIIIDARNAKVLKITHSK